MDSFLCFSIQCPCCDKSFLNAFFLKSHMQRRHPEEFETRTSQTFADSRLPTQQKGNKFISVFNSELHSDGEKKSQIESLKQEIGSLKEQIAQQQQELHTKTVQVRKPGC